jgi:hypothetical protein
MGFEPKTEIGIASGRVMEEGKIKNFFDHQVHAVMDRAAADPESFLPYFADHDPRDEEILALLAISTLLGGEFHAEARFPTPVEALAALPPDLRAEICNSFRELLRKCLRTAPAA